MRNFCDCNDSRGGLLLAAVIAIAELFSVYIDSKNRVEMVDELNHYKDESRYLRSELDRTRKEYLTTEKELHQTTLAFQAYANGHPPTEEELAELGDDEELIYFPY